MSLMFLLSSTIINICISSALFQFSFQVRCNANNGLTCRGISDTKTCLSPWFHLGLCLCGSLLWDLEEKKKKKQALRILFSKQAGVLFPPPPPHIFLLGENTFGHPKGYLLKKTHSVYHPRSHTSCGKFTGHKSFSFHLKTLNGGCWGGGGAARNKQKSIHIIKRMTGGSSVAPIQFRQRF